MTSMKAGSSLRTLAAAMTLALAPMAASAATVTVIDSSTNGPGNQAHVFAGSHNAVLPGGGTWAAGQAAMMIDPPPGVSVGDYQSPFNNTPLVDVNSFWSVGPGTGPSPSLIEYANQQNSFKFLWGSIDTYNTLTFLDNGNPVFSITGTTLAETYLGATGPNNTRGNYELVALVRFNDFQQSFNQVKFESSGAAFEFAMVPLPAAGWLLLTALGGLAVAGRRRKAAAA